MEYLCQKKRGGGGGGGGSDKRGSAVLQTNKVNILHTDTKLGISTVE